jgi:Uma2 family endonuclease
MSALPAEPALDPWEDLRQIDHDPAYARYKAELLEGTVVVTPPPHPDHERDISATIEQIVIEKVRRQLPIAFWAGGTGLSITGPNGVKPDLLVTDRDAFSAPEDHLAEYHRPEGQGILLVVEVTSKSTRDKDYGAKMRAYASARIPTYLIIDRQDKLCRLYHLHHTDEQYGLPDQVVGFGTPLPLPEPLAFALDTSSFA